MGCCRVCCGFLRLGGGGDCCREAPDLDSLLFSQPEEARPRVWITQGTPGVRVQVALQPHHVYLVRSEVPGADAPVAHRYPCVSCHV